MRPHRLAARPAGGALLSLLPASRWVRRTPAGARGRGWPARRRPQAREAAAVSHAGAILGRCADQKTGSGRPSSSARRSARWRTPKSSSSMSEVVFHRLDHAGALARLHEWTATELAPRPVIRGVVSGLVLYRHEGAPPS